MGLDYNIMRAMVLDGKREPYSGRAYTLGRQSMAPSPEETLHLFRESGWEATALPDVSDIALDDATTMAKRESHRGPRIRDVDFFGMLGFKQTLAIDVSGFEGAEVILDLNKPLPPDLARSADLVADGSLLDNIFDPVTGLKNIARLLTSTGRCFLLNTGNHMGIPYSILSPIWFFDYFAWNNFKYCQVYVTIYDQAGHSVYAISYDHAARRWGLGLMRWMLTLGAGVAITVYAEKGPESTWDRIPTQANYRSEEEWERYIPIVQGYAEQNRPYLLESRNTHFESANFPPGYVRVFPGGNTQYTGLGWNGRDI